MTLQIKPCVDVTVIGPLLRVLRDALPENTFETRLLSALEGGYRVLVAQSQSGVQGCLGYRITQDVFWGKTLYIDDLVVLTNARGQGIGGALLDAAKKEAHVQSCDHVRLCSGLSRAKAHRFYERNGFAKTSLQFFYAVQNGET